MISKINTYFIAIILILSPVFLQAQQESESIASITGVVLSSETRQPIPGVRVSIPGVASSITDDDGKFNLRRTEEGAIIQFRGQGYAYKEVAAGEKTELSVELHDESFNTVFREIATPFGVKSWRQATGAMTNISNRENYKKAIVSGESLIQDEGLGVNTLMRSGAPGAGGNMYLRGFTSLRATNQPLIVIDGVPFENVAIAPSLITGNHITPLTGFDVKDIENITILKDATSIYGSKGANGVILIETAKVMQQATTIDFHAYAGINQAHETLYPMMNAWQYRAYITELLASSGQYSTAQIQALPYINREAPVVQPWGIEGNRDYYRYNQDTDWQKEIFRNSLSQNYYMSIKGGDDVAIYALSVGVLNREGTIENTNFNRYNAQFKAQINVTPRLKINPNMNFSYSDRLLAFQGMSPNYNPLQISLLKAPILSPYFINEYGVLTPNYEQVDVFGITNPLVLVDENTSLNDIHYRFFGNVSATADLGKNLDLGVILGVTFDKVRETIFLPENGLQHDALPNGFVTNRSMASVARYFQYYTDARIGYNRVFNRKHSVSGKLGFRYQTNDTEGDWVQTNNSTSDDMKTVGNGRLDMTSTSGIIGDWKWTSFYLNGEYGYLNRYFLSLNMAMDGSSRFGKDAAGLKMGDNVFGVFPSISGAWIVSSESFMDGINAIDLLKLRIGYSISGNDDIGNYSARTVYTSQNFLGFYGLTRANIANSELKWETNAKFNIGADIVVYNERLNVSFDVYQSVTKDLLGWRQSEGFHGINGYVVNDGKMQNRGFELGINGRIINREIKWDMGVNLARYKNKIVDLSVDEMITEIAGGNVLTKVGNPAGLFYGYKTDGVYSTSAEAAVEGLNIQSGYGQLFPFQAGDVRFVNANNNDNIIDERDMLVIGDPNPDFFGSVNSRLQWKRLTLNAVFTFSYGNDIYNAVRASTESMTGFENQTKNVANRWRYEGHDTSVPKAVWGDPMGNARFSDRWIEDGSYLRLKNLSLAYEIPIRQKFVKGIQVYITANNLVTFTKYLGYDPEFSAMQTPLAYGIDVGMAPMPRTFFAGIKLGL